MFPTCSIEDIYPVQEADLQTAFEEVARLHTILPSLPAEYDGINSQNFAVVRNFSILPEEMCTEISPYKSFVSTYLDCVDLRGRRRKTLRTLKHQLSLKMFDLSSREIWE